MLRCTISHLSKQPVRAVVPQPCILPVVRERLPFSTKAKPQDAQKKHSIAVEREASGNKTTPPTTSKPHPPIELPYRHPFWKNTLWDDDDFFFNSPPPFGPFFSSNSPLLSRDWFHHDPWFFRRSNPSTIMSDGLIHLKSSPTYHWQQYEDHIELSVQIPQGITNTQVEVEDEKRILHVNGEHNTKKESSVSQMKFEQQFKLPSNAIIEDIKARRADGGVLKVLVPTRTEKTASSFKRSIPVEKEIPTEEEVLQQSYSDAFDESDWAEAGKQKQAA